MTPWWFPQVRPHVRESSPLPVTSPQHDGPGDRLRLSEAPGLVDVISSGVQGCQPRQPCYDWYTISRVEIVCYQEEIGVRREEATTGPRKQRELRDICQTDLDLRSKGQYCGP